MSRHANLKKIVKEAEYDDEDYYQQYGDYGDYGEE